MIALRCWGPIVLACLAIDAVRPASAQPPRSLQPQRALHTVPQQADWVYLFEDDQMLMADSIGGLWHWRQAPTSRVTLLKQRELTWTDARWAADAKIILAVNADRSVWRIDLNDCSAHQAWEVPNRPLAFAVSPDGKTVALTVGMELQLRNAEDGSIRHRLRGYRHMIESASFSRDGRRLIAGGSDHLLHVWDVADGSHESAFDGAHDYIASVWYLDDSTAAARLSSGNLIVRELLADASVRRFSLGAFATSSAASWQGGVVAMSGHAGTIKLWQLSDGDSLGELPMDQPILGLRILGDGRLRCMTHDMVLRTLDIPKMQWQEQIPLSSHLHGITTLTLVQDRWVVTGGSESYATVFDHDQGHMLGRIAVPQGPVTSVCALPGRSEVLIVDRTGVSAVDVPSTETRWRLEMTPAQRIAAVAPSGNSFALAQHGPLADDHHIEWRSLVHPANPVHRLRGHTQPVSALTFASDDELLSVGLDGMVHRWKPDQETPVASTADESPLLCVAFDSRRNLAAVGSADGRILLLQLADMSRRPMRTSRRPVRALAFLPNATLVSASGDRGVIEVWNPADATLIASAQAQASGIHALAPLTSLGWWSAGFDNRVLYWSMPDR